MAPQELERAASKYASEAIIYDSQGGRGMALTSYQKAIEINTKYANAHLNLGNIFFTSSEILSTPGPLSTNSHFPLLSHFLSNASLCPQ